MIILRQFSLESGFGAEALMLKERREMQNKVIFFIVI
jgi:hypothetical protein